MLDNLKRKIHEYFISRTDFLSVKDRLSEDQLRIFVAKTLDDFCAKEEVSLTDE